MRTGDSVINRDIIYQVALLIVIAVVIYLVAMTTQANLARLGVDSSIDFLWKRAGFEIGQKLIPYDANSTIARAFVVALLNTLLLAAVSIVCASILGLFIGIARLSDNWLVSRLALVYIEVFRNIPSLLQIFFWYFVVLRTLPRSDESIEFFRRHLPEQPRVVRAVGQFRAGRVLDRRGVAGRLRHGVLAAAAGTAACRRPRSGPF